MLIWLCVLMTYTIKHIAIIVCEHYDVTEVIRIKKIVYL